MLGQPQRLRAGPEEQPAEQPADRQPAEQPDAPACRARRRPASRPTPADRGGAGGGHRDGERRRTGRPARRSAPPPRSARTGPRPRESSSSVGSPTCTSEASTGSVGASAAPSSSAAAGARPAHHQPSSATAAMVSGIAIASSRQVDDQRRQPSGRSSFSPAPISATITPTSVRCSVIHGCASGSGTGRPRGSAKTSMPRPRNAIGMDSGAALEQPRQQGGEQRAHARHGVREVDDGHPQCLPGIGRPRHSILGRG